MERSHSHASTSHLLIFVLWNLLFLSLGCEEVERQALLSFRQSLSDPANLLSSWSSPDCCNWSGISCHNKTGRVIKLDLRNQHEYQDRFLFNIQEVNSSLLHLKYLEYMDLSGNDFQQIPIPNFFGNFHELRYLNLSNTGFGGNVPHHLGNLSNLRSLDLSSPKSNITRVDGLSWVSGLSSLQFLDMSGLSLNSVSNPLRAINLLPRLLELRLAFCELRSYSYLSNLTALTVLDLSLNPINSPFPSHLGNFTSLEVLSLSASGFWGPFPDHPGSMIRLENVDFSDNNLTGTVENVFSKMCNLKSLSLRGNHVHGMFPNLFQNSSCLQTNRLEILDLAGNQFNGTIPPYLGNFTSLRILDLGSNHFQGVISEVHFEKLSNLKYLDLSFNSLSLKMRSGWLPPFQLETISLPSINIGTEFPLWLTTQNRFNRLDLYNTSLRGELPRSFFNFSLSDSSSDLQIDLSSNQLHGNIPNILKSNDQRLELLLNNNNFEGTLPHVPPNTPFIDLSYNSLSGSITLIPEESKSKGLQLHDFSLKSLATFIFQLPPSSIFIFAHNSFSGTIPYSFCKYKGLQILDLSFNNFTGGFPNCLCGLPYLRSLDISSNELVGVIPDSIGTKNSLQYLHLSNTKFNGQIPSSMKNCTKLEILDLGKNKFSGSIHLWIGEHLQSLRVLSLRSNELNGSIPSQLCLLRGLTFLDLSQNNLSGPIPPCFPNFTYMVTPRPFPDEGSHLPRSWLLLVMLQKFPLVTFHTKGNQGTAFFYDIPKIVRSVIKGQEVEYSEILRFVTLLDLSSNNLGGEIPESLTKLHTLRALNLSRNRLEGNIPGKIGDMLGLESLDLSQSGISGIIPPSMSNLNFLSHLNLSQNNLSGEIPSGRQLQTLDDPSIYMGNPQLCGAPLKKKCRPDEPSEDHRKNESLHKNGFEINWFYIGLASGHVVGFGGFCAILFLNRKWRYAYYQVLSSVTDWLVVTAIVNIARMKRNWKVNQIRE